MLIDQLISVPQREKAGSTTAERIDYQALWGLTLIFKHFGGLADYAVCFEFHDDVLLLNSATNPTSLRFYQVKTKDKGHWTLADLTRRKNKKDGSGLLLSHVGKMQENFEHFPDATGAMIFVSNIPCALFNGISGTSFAEIDKTDFQGFLKKLTEECPNASEKSAALMHFEVADLGLTDSSTHLKGKLHDLVVTQLGEVSYNLDALYKTVATECRARSKFTGAITCLDDLLKSKTITKAQVAEWLQIVKATATLPTWETVSADLALPPMEKAALSRECARLMVWRHRLGSRRVRHQILQLPPWMLPRRSTGRFGIAEIPVND
ncbi:MAG: dsDNA nuclease domain-containing protein [Rhizomicrobium sp.]